MGRNRRGFTKQFKVDAVKLVTEQGYKLAEAARNLGIDPSVLRGGTSSTRMPRPPSPERGT